MIPKPHEVDVPPEVIQAAIRGKLTFFIGNGLSRLYGYPSWGGLADLMLTELAKEREISFNDLELLKKLPVKTKISIADSYFKKNWKLGEKKKTNLTYEAILKRSENKKKLKEDQIFLLLAKCKVKFITTNYDDLLDKQLNIEHGNDFDKQEIGLAKKEKSESTENVTKDKFEIISDPKKLKFISPAKETVLLHLHGSLGSEEDQLIASTSDYLELYTNSEFKEKFVEFLKDQTLIFIGYGLEELEVLEMLFRASELNTDEQKHIILLPLMSHEQYLLEHLKQYWGGLGFKLEPYNTDEKGFDSIGDLIHKWAPVIAEEAKPPLPTKNNDGLDNIITKFEGASL